MKSFREIREKKDACYSKVKSRYKVWPSAYASGALSKCRKVGANNWGNKSEQTDAAVSEDLRQWFKDKWVRFGPDGKIRGDCARGDDSEGKPKCLPQSKAHALGKEGRASAAARKRRQDPDPDRSGAAINVDTHRESINLKTEPLMRTFFQLREQSDRANRMVGTIGSDKKGLRHLKNYVMPHLSAEGRQKTAAAFAEHGTLDHEGHGAHHNPKAAHNFTLGTRQGEHAPGTPVRVTHISQGANNSLIAHTEKHGQVSMAALNKPEALKKPAITREGFNVEGTIAKHLGTTAAGSTKHGYDFHYGAGENQVRGKVKHTAEVDKKTGGATPIVRGESKLDKGKMGQSTLKHTRQRGWHFTNESLAPHLEKAQINGKPILQHMNEHHSNGVIDRPYAIPAPAGMAQHYLKSSNVNTLHIHNKKDGHGTTFTIGAKNSLKGKTKLGHLHDKDLERLNGTLQIEKTTTGSTQAAHRPKHGVMKELANMSRTNPNKHRDLTNEQHAHEFKQHLAAHELGENFQDGRNPQDKGDMARHGLKGKSISALKKVRSSASASPRKKQLAHWFINMNKGKG